MDGTISHAAYCDMVRLLDSVQTAPPTNPLVSGANLFGVRIQPSSAFPFEAECSACKGTGEGTESTYCDKCSGAGRQRFEGVMQNGSQTILLTGKLPKAFAPYFPKGLVPPAPLSRGLT